MDKELGNHFAIEESGLSVLPCDMPVEQDYDEMRPHVTEGYAAIWQLLLIVPAFEAANIRSIYVPASGTDVSPSAFFPNASVTYGDISPQVVSALQNHGFTAVEADISTYTPEPPVDLTVLFNTMGDDDKNHFIDSVIEGGYILDSHWSGTPRPSFIGDPRISLIGAIRENPEDESWYFDTIVTAEELFYDVEDITAGMLLRQERRDIAFLFQRNINSTTT